MSDLSTRNSTEAADIVRLAEECQKAIDNGAAGEWKMGAESLR